MIHLPCGDFSDRRRVEGLVGAVAAAGFGSIALEAAQVAPASFWPRLIRACRAAVERPLEIWLGVEDRERPGAIAAPGDEHRQRILRLRERDSSLPLPEGEEREQTLAFLLRRDGPVLHESIFIPVGGRQTLAGPGTTVLLVDQVICPDLAGLDRRGALDPLAPDAVEAFVRERYEAMLDRPELVGARPGLRLAPASYHLGDSCPDHATGLPWMAGLAQIVRLRHGIDLLARLPELLYRRANGRHQELRWAYRETLTTYFVQNFSGYLARWCDRRGLRLGGAIGRDATLASQVRGIGAAMRHHEVMHEPAIPFDPRDGPLAALQLASVARATGRPARARIGPATGWGTPLAELRRLAESALVLGIDRRSFDSVGSTLKGHRKRDRARCGLHPAAPGWRHLPLLEAHLRALGELLEEMESCGEVAILHPIESAWTVGSPGEKAPLAALDDDLDAILRAALDAQVQVDLVDEDQLARIGVVEREGGRPLIRMGGHACSVLVIPPVLRLRATTLAAVQRLLELSGPVLAVRRGGFAASGVDPDTAALLSDQRAAPLAAAQVAEVLPKRIGRLLGQRIVVRERDSGELAPVWLRRGRLRGRDACLVVSRAPRRALDLAIESRETLQLWEPASGARAALPAHSGGFALHLPPGASALLVAAGADAEERAPSGPLAAQVRADLALTRAHLPEEPGAELARERELPDPETIELIGARAIPLGTTRWRLVPSAGPSPRPSAAGDAPSSAALAFSEPCPVSDAQRAIRLLADRPWACAEADRCLLRMDFRIESPPPAPVALVVESIEGMIVRCNGARPPHAASSARRDPPLDAAAAIEAGAWLDPSFLAFDVTELLREGSNSASVEVDLDPELELEAPLLVGALVLAGDDPRIAAAPRTLELRDLSTQGLAHHVGEIVYTWTLEGPIGGAGGRVILDLVPGEEPPGGASIEVELDGAAIGAAPWRGHRIDLESRLAAPGAHRLSVRVLGHLKNVLDPAGPEGAPPLPLGLLHAPRLLLLKE